MESFLPNEILLQILLFIDQPKDLLNLQSTCNKLYSIVEDFSGTLWESLYHEFFVLNPALLGREFSFLEATEFLKAEPPQYEREDVLWKESFIEACSLVVRNREDISTLSGYYTQIDAKYLISPPTPDFEIQRFRSRNSHTEPTFFKIPSGDMLYRSYHTRNDEFQFAYKMVRAEGVVFKDSGHGSGRYGPHFYPLRIYLHPSETPYTEVPKTQPAPPLLLCSEENLASLVQCEYVTLKGTLVINDNGCFVESNGFFINLITHGPASMQNRKSGDVMHCVGHIEYTIERDEKKKYFFQPYYGKLT